jgi:hypothetical protein
MKVAIVLLLLAIAIYFFGRWAQRKRNEWWKGTEAKPYDEDEEQP